MPTVRAGSPAESNYRRLTTVAINEVLTHTDLPLEDAIELHNLTGSPIDVSGCVATTATANVYMVSVVWQGINKTAVPATTCGSGSYDSENTRRAVTNMIRVPDLSGS